MQHDVLSFGGGAEDFRIRGQVYGMTKQDGSGQIQVFYSTGDAVTANRCMGRTVPDGMQCVRGMGTTMTPTVALWPPHFLPLVLGPSGKGEVVLKTVVFVIVPLTQKTPGNPDIKVRARIKNSPLVTHDFTPGRIHQVPGTPFKELPRGGEDTNSGGVRLE